MTPQEFANKINGRQIRNELTEAEEKEAKAAGLVVIFGASDDLAELRGAIYDEVSFYDGGTIYFAEDDLLKNECESDNCPHEMRKEDAAKTVEALWCKEEGYSWTYETEIPHATFEVLEDNDKYCRGIVFHKADLI